MIRLRYEGDYLDNCEIYRTKGGAIAAFRSTALELARYGQSISATLHIEVLGEAEEYPDFLLSLGVRGGVKVERCY